MIYVLSSEQLLQMIINLSQVSCNTFLDTFIKLWTHLTTFCCNSDSCKTLKQLLFTFTDLYFTAFKETGKFYYRMFFTVGIICVHIWTPQTTWWWDLDGQKETEESLIKWRSESQSKYNIRAEYSLRDHYSGLWSTTDNSQVWWLLSRCWQTLFHDRRWSTSWQYFLKMTPFHAFDKVAVVCIALEQSVIQWKSFNQSVIY